MRDNACASLSYILILVLTSLVAYSCAGPLGVVRGRYNDELAGGTHEARVYSGIEERLSVIATYRGASFKEAYSDYYATSFGLTDEEKARLHEKDRADIARYNEFLLSVHTSEPRLNNFDAKDSPWKIYLIDSSGGKISPLSVKRVERGDALRGAFFPYIDLWSTAYVLRFPAYIGDGKTPFPARDATFIKLSIRSVLGMVELKWPLKSKQP